MLTRLLKLTGCTKKMKISRKIFQSDGTSRTEDKVLTINVKPGWKAGTKITFQREGDQTPNKIPADIVFIIRDKPHSLFKRDGSDLRYTAKMSLREVSSLYGASRSMTLIHSDRGHSRFPDVNRYATETFVSIDVRFINFFSDVKLCDLRVLVACNVLNEC
jgi:DnaJ-class molecular chaperone